MVCAQVLEGVVLPGLYIMALAACQPGPTTILAIISSTVRLLYKLWQTDSSTIWHRLISSSVRGRTPPLPQGNRVPPLHSSGVDLLVKAHAGCVGACTRCFCVSLKGVWEPFVPRGHQCSGRGGRLCRGSILRAGGGTDRVPSSSRGGPDPRIDRFHLLGRDRPKKDIHKRDTG